MEKVPYAEFKAQVDEVNEYKAKIKELEVSPQVDEVDYEEKYLEVKRELDELTAEVTGASKKNALKQAGYTDEQVEKYLGFVTGSTAEEISASIAELKRDIPVKSSNNKNTKWNPWR